MRELKFRVWDKEKKEWFPIKNGLSLVLNHEDTYLAFNTQNGPYRIPDTGQKGMGINRWCVEQFTGLKDKNGREIYEGDILKSDGLILEVIWANGETLSFYGEEYAYNPTGFILKSKSTGAFGDDEYYSIGQEFSFTNCGYTGVVGKFSEIIGNIHENPELINATL